MKKIETILESDLSGLSDLPKIQPRESSNEDNRSKIGDITPLEETRKGHSTLLKGKYRTYLLIAILGVIIQFTIFKILYPFPDFISDSYSYIATNIYKMDVNLWPIGYSKFLFLIHQINHSDIFLTAVQYFILEASLAYFFISILNLYHPKNGVVLALYIFLFFNPLFLYLSNAVLSDALFASLTIVFCTHFLRSIRKPSISSLIAQAVIVGIAFTIRYTAIYYPLVAIAGLLLSKYKTVERLADIAIGIALMASFYIYTCKKTREQTGTSEFSVFGGWQIANNALYMYNHINVDSAKLPVEMRELDQLSRFFFKKVNPPQEEINALPGTYFIKIPYAILKPYMSLRYAYNDPIEQFKAWGKVSPIYKRYGTYLITHYPISFTRYYLLPNTKNYLLPHLEKFSTYNLDINTVPSHVQNWFDYTTPDIHAVSTSFQGKLFYLFPLLFMALNIYFLASLFWTFFKGGWSALGDYTKKTIAFISIFILLNFAFSVFATPVVLRYQIVPMILLFSFSLILFDYPDYRKKPTPTIIK